MPFDISVLPVFLAVSFVLLVTPGPDVAFIVQLASQKVVVPLFGHQSVFLWRCLYIRFLPPLE